MSIHTRTVQHNYSVRRHPLARPLKPQSRPIPWGPNRERFPPPGKTQNLDTRNTNYSSLKKSGLNGTGSIAIGVAVRFAWAN